MTWMLINVFPTIMDFVANVSYYMRIETWLLEKLLLFGFATMLVQFLMSL